MQPAATVIMYQPKWGWEKLAERNGIFIQQQFDILEYVSGCETENRFHIYPISNDGDPKGRQIFKAREKSSWCARNCMHPHCRPFNMMISNQDPLSEEIDGSQFLKLERDCALTICCFNRPLMTVQNVEKGAAEYLGQVRNPWLCCELGGDVYNNQDNKIYEIRGTSCQSGVLCNTCPCDSCQQVHFDVKGPSGEVLSTLDKRSSGCLAAYLAVNTDMFTLTFPINASREEKALLLASVLLLDFTYFDQKDKNAQNNSMNMGL